MIVVLDQTRRARHKIGDGRTCERQALVAVPLNIAACRRCRDEGQAGVGRPDDATHSGTMDFVKAIQSEGD